MENTKITEDGVWILIAGWFYDSQSILGVFTSEELAYKIKGEKEQTNEQGYDYYKVQNHSVICS